MILVWTKSNEIKAILRNGQVEFKTLEEVERITQLKYKDLKDKAFVDKYNFERIKSQIDHLQLFMKRKLMRVALCV